MKEKMDVVSEPVKSKASQRRNWTIRGQASAGGGTFHKVTVRGEGTVNGDLACDQLKVMGSMRIAGNTELSTASVMGTLSIDGGVRGETFSVLGECTVRGDCSVDVLRVKGACEIAGMVNADRVDIDFYGSSEIHEIGCETASIKPRKQWFKNRHCVCVIDTIEGDDLHLEQVQARVIRGNRVEIGPNCKVERVEYGASLSVHPSAHVAERINT